MKRAIFIFYLFIAFIGIDTTSIDDDFVEKIAEHLSISKTDAQICMNKTNVVPEDFMKLDELMYDHVTTEDIDKSVLKVGCLLACLLQKRGMLLGPHINVEKIRKFVHTKIGSNSEGIAVSNRILDKCTDLVKSKTDECEVTTKLLLCATTEIKRLRTVN